jgi:hypothetical protein
MKATDILVDCFRYLFSIWGRRLASLICVLSRTQFALFRFSADKARSFISIPTKQSVKVNDIQLTVVLPLFVLMIISYVSMLHNFCSGDIYVLV